MQKNVYLFILKTLSPLINFNLLANINYIYKTSKNNNYYLLSILMKQKKKKVRDSSLDKVLKQDIYGSITRELVKKDVWMDMHIPEC